VTVRDYHHATLVAGVPKPMRNIIIRDYDSDEKGQGEAVHSIASTE
jgi:hypothetical protein